MISEIIILLLDLSELIGIEELASGATTVPERHFPVLGLHGVEEMEQMTTSHLYGITWVDQDLEPRLLPKKAKEKSSATSNF